MYVDKTCLFQDQNDERSGDDDPGPSLPKRQKRVRPSMLSFACSVLFSVFLFYLLRYSF